MKNIKNIKQLNIQIKVIFNEQIQNKNQDLKNIPAVPNPEK